jgi:hypothetical protein
VKEGQEGQPEEAYMMWGWRSWTAVRVVRGGGLCWQGDAKLTLVLGVIAPPSLDSRSTSLSVDRVVRRLFL